jgi:hypothetical protein
LEAFLLNVPEAFTVRRKQYFCAFFLELLSYGYAATNMPQSYARRSKKNTHQL